MRIFLFFVLMSINITAFASTPPHQCQDNTIFNVGAGIYDITGPAAEEGMMGYAMLNQKTAGILQRLWARAFIIESPCNGKRVVFVNADLGQVFQGIKELVVQKLQEKYKDTYSDDNVLITATHTHSGPGGFSTYALYNLTTLGFSRKNFDTIINGIVKAIERAQNNMTPAHISLAKGQLQGVTFNRSPQSYLLNPPAERSRYAGDTDTEMTLIRFDSLAGKPLGTLNWFPVHGVSMNNKNHLINGDNKGYAEYLFEKDFASDYGDQAFVAAFAQANAGDVSPNQYNHEGGEGLEGMLAVEKAGRPQYEEAKKLFEQAVESLKGGVDYRHTFVEMDKVTIDPRYTDGIAHTTCPAAIGLSMLAGTQDGEGLGEQGISCDTISSLFPEFMCKTLSTPCQGVKPIALQMGLMKPYPWVSQILPFQVIRIGNLVIAALPFELTTMSGRRIKDTISHELPASENDTVVLSALSNAYVQYIATNEEYQLQRYEGASTVFGPWSLAAIQQEIAKLTQALVKNLVVSEGPKPPDLSASQINLQTDVIYDAAPPTKQFGDVHQDVNAHYKPGDIVQAVFWGGHPKNDYHTQGSFLAVQHLENGQWTTIRQDRDWDTDYTWQRSWIAYSLITITWRIPTDVAPGQYRLVHDGDAKSLTGTLTPYTAYSSIFTIG